MTLPVDPNKTTLSGPGADRTQEVDALLTRANLLRIRGNMREAIDCCMAAMRIVPGSVPAQSLLGDIYESKGSIDEAVQWYRMALDANPNSAADKQKLARLLAMRGQSLDPIHGATATPNAGLGPGGGAPLSFSNRSLRGTESTVRLSPIHGAPFALPPFGPSKAATLALRAAAVIIGLALLMIVLTAVVQSHARWGASPTPPLPAPTPLHAVPVDPNAALPRDPFEIALAASLREATGVLLPNMKFADVIADPRGGRLTLTFVARPDEPISRDFVLRECLRAAELSTQSEVPEASTYNYLTIRLLLSPDDLALASNEGSLIFVGDISRADIDGDGDPSDMSSNQVQLAFTNQWWVSDLSN
jgi:hypothetical protein